MAEFDGRVALVTGAAGAGIGRATARRLAAGGAAVAVSDVHERRTGEAAAELAAEFGAERIRGHVLDAGDRAGIDRVVAAVAEELGPVDLLVNNAAVNVLRSVVEMTPEEWDRTIAVDLSGPWYLCRAVLPGMRERGRGAIVNVTSVAAFLSAANEGPYAAAKAALHSLTRTLAAENGPYGIRCNAVAPAIIASRFVDVHRRELEPQIQQTPLGRVGEASEVADVIAFLCSEQSSFVTGEVLTVGGGLYMHG